MKFKLVRNEHLGEVAVFMTVWSCVVNLASSDFTVIGTIQDGQQPAPSTASVKEHTAAEVRGLN